MRALVLTCLLLTPLPALSEDWNFRRAVADMEDQLGTRRVRIPMWGLMKFVAYPVHRPLGVKDFDMAVFEDGRALRRGEQRVFGRLGPGWRPILRVKERDHDSVTMYGRDEGNWIRLLMLTVGGGDAVLMQFKLRPSRLMVFLSQTASRRGRRESGEVH